MDIKLVNHIIFDTKYQRERLIGRANILYLSLQNCSTVTMVKRRIYDVDTKCAAGTYTTFLLWYLLVSHDNALQVCVWMNWIYVTRNKTRNSFPRHGFGVTNLGRSSIKVIGSRAPRVLSRIVQLIKLLPRAATLSNFLSNCWDPKGKVRLFFQAPLQMERGTLFSTT